MCIIGILSENRGKNYCSESRLGGTRSGKLVGELKVVYTSHYE